MTTYLITSVDVQSYNRDIRLHIDFSKEEDKCPPKFIRRQNLVAPILRVENDQRRDWLTRCEDRWLTLINGWYHYEFGEPFVFIKLNKKEVKK